MDYPFDVFGMQGSDFNIPMQYIWIQCASETSTGDDKSYDLALSLSYSYDYSTGGHRTRVAAVTLDNMAERVFAQREDLPWFFGVNYWFSWYFW